MKNIGVICSINDAMDYDRLHEALKKFQTYSPYVFFRDKNNKDSAPFIFETIKDPRLKELDRWIRHDRIDLIYATSARLGVKALAVKHKWQIPMIVHIQDRDYSGNWKLKRKQWRRLFRVADHMVVPSRYLEKKLRKRGYSRKKITVLHQGVDVNAIPFKERRYQEDEPVRIVFAGEWEPKNGIEYLLKAFCQLHQKKPNTHLHLVGKGSLKRKIDKFVRKKQLEHAVKLSPTSSSHKSIRVYEQAHIFCLPGIKDKKGNIDAIPVTLKEAMAAGLPVVTTDHAGIPELVTDDIHGYLVPPKDSGSLAKTLEKMIDSHALWPEMGKKARDRIRKYFNLDRQMEKQEKIMDQVVQRTARYVKKPPFFSVIIPTYNRKKHVKKAVKSVLKQKKYDDYEIIVVDDGSKDGTRRRIEKFGPRVRYIYQRNKGPSKARNTGIKYARGEYIAFLDSDDQFVPEKLRKNKKYLEKHPDCMFLYSWYYDKRKGKRKKVKKPKKCKKLNEFRYRLYRREFTIRTSTVVVHRRCFDEVGKFNTKYRYSQDWDMWLRLATLYLGHCQKKPLAIYRRRDRKKNEKKVHQYHKEIRRRARKLYKWSNKKINKLEKKYKSKAKKKKQRQKKSKKKQKRKQRRRKKTNKKVRKSKRKKLVKQRETGKRKTNSSRRKKNGG
ncbi:MAG: glycosyltransferase [Bacillaceae bacterium]|nr:glycosyltransferase [Bacillaceae bacterium]